MFTLDRERQNLLKKLTFYVVSYQDPFGTKIPLKICKWGRGKGNDLQILKPSANTGHNVEKDHQLIYHLIHMT